MLNYILHAPYLESRNNQNTHIPRTCSFLPCLLTYNFKTPINKIKHSFLPSSYYLLLYISYHIINHHLFQCPSRLVWSGLSWVGGPSSWFAVAHNKSNRLSLSPPLLNNNHNQEEKYKIWFYESSISSCIISLGAINPGMLSIRCLSLSFWAAASSAYRSLLSCHQSPSIINTILFI